MKIYIIGNIPEKIDKKCIFEYNKAELKLIKIGFQTYNPLNEFINTKIDLKELKEINLMNLINSESVFILNDCDLLSIEKNYEIRIAIRLNLLIIYDLI